MENMGKTSSSYLFLQATVHVETAVNLLSVMIMETHDPQSRCLTHIFYEKFCRNKDDFGIGFDEACQLILTFGIEGILKPKTLRIRIFLPRP
jgi:hypothetical protein